MTVVRTPRLDELSSLSELCLRSKAHWGYDAAFIEACRVELRLDEADLRTTKVGVIDEGASQCAVAQVGRVSDVADLLKLFVDPAAMGRGYGRVLFDWCTEVARDWGVQQLTIEADPGAEPFYRRIGAVPAGTAPSGSIPGRVLPRLVYHVNRHAAA